MEINSRFNLPIGPDAAFALLLDLDEVAPCLPGAQLGTVREDESRELTVAIRLGPMKFAYAGDVRVAEHDPATRRAVLTGRASEQRGQGTAEATIAMTVAPDGNGGSSVDSTAVFELTGRAGQTGRGIVEDVARKMIADMATCLATRSAPTEAPTERGDRVEPSTGQPEAARELRAGRFLVELLLAWLRRLLRRRGT